MKFRKATNDDLAKAWDIVRNARDRMIAIGRKQWTATYPSAEIIAKDIDDGNAFVIADGENIAAYGCITLNGEPEYSNPLCEWSIDGDYIVVHRLAVSESYRCKGLARMFFAEVEAMALSQNVASLKVDTNYDNIEMLHLLPSIGFIRRGIVPYRKGERIAFEKKLG